MGRKDEYDWLDDPFNDKKSSRKKMTGGSKAFVGIGCVIAVVVVCVLIVMVIAGLAGLGTV